MSAFKKIGEMGSSLMKSAAKAAQTLDHSKEGVARSDIPFLLLRDKLKLRKTEELRQAWTIVMDKVPMSPTLEEVADLLKAVYEARGKVKE